MTEEMTEIREGTADIAESAEAEETSAEAEAAAPAEAVEMTDSVQTAEAAEPTEAAEAAVPAAEQDGAAPEQAVPEGTERRETQGALQEKELSPEEKERCLADIEGILFTLGRSVSREELGMALELPPKQAEQLALELQERFAQRGGLMILKLEHSFQMCTRESCFDALIRIVSHPRRPVLTEVVLETLTIIAYRQPVTKLEIANIRGVSSDHAVNKLIEYGLVCEQGRLNAPGRPILFGTTEEFLRQFRLSSLEDLPLPEAGRLAEIQEEVAAEYPVTV